MVGPLITQCLVKQALQGPPVPCMQVLAVNRPLTISRLGAKPNTETQNPGHASVRAGIAQDYMHQTHTKPCPAQRLIAAAVRANGAAGAASAWRCSSGGSSVCRRKASSLSAAGCVQSTASKAHPNADAEARATSMSCQCNHACIYLWIQRVPIKGGVGSLARPPQQQPNARKMHPCSQHVLQLMLLLVVHEIDHALRATASTKSRTQQIRPGACVGSALP